MTAIFIPTSYKITCDCCPTESVVLPSTMREARLELEREGWLTVRKIHDPKELLDICPSCAEARRAMQTG